MVMIDFTLADIKLESSDTVLFAENKEKPVIGFQRYFHLS